MRQIYHLDYIITVVCIGAYVLPFYIVTAMQACFQALFVIWLQFTFRKDIKHKNMVGKEHVKILPMIAF